MFRIDREYVSFIKTEKLEEVYTTIRSEAQTAAVSTEKVQLEAKKALENAEAEAERILLEARHRAEEILAQAQAEAESLKREAEAAKEPLFEAAKEQGYAEGYSAGSREAEREYGESLGEIGQLLQKIGDERNAVIDGLEGEIIDLVLKISEKVINVQLEKDDKTFVELIQGALTRLKGEGKIFIRVSPEEYNRIFSSGLALPALDSEGRSVSAVQESLFERWDCVLENEEETLDAGVGSQFKRIALALRGLADESL